jgi:hypothetical protein
MMAEEGSARVFTVGSFSLGSALRAHERCSRRLARGCSFLFVIQVQFFDLFNCSIVSAIFFVLLIICVSHYHALGALLEDLVKTS